MHPSGSRGIQARLARQRLPDCPPPHPPVPPLPPPAAVSCLALTCHFNLLPVKSSLKNPSLSNMLRVIRISVLACAVIYSAVAVSGALEGGESSGLCLCLQLGMLAQSHASSIAQLSSILLRVLLLAGYTLFGSLTDGDVLKNLTVHSLSELVPKPLAHAVVNFIAVFFSFNLLVNFVLKVSST